jgi:hypothetical protein
VWYGSKTMPRKKPNKLINVIYPRKTGRSGGVGSLTEREKDQLRKAVENGGYKGFFYDYRRAKPLQDRTELLDKEK